MGQLQQEGRVGLLRRVIALQECDELAGDLFEDRGMTAVVNKELAHQLEPAVLTVDRAQHGERAGQQGHQIAQKQIPVDFQAPVLNTGWRRIACRIPKMGRKGHLLRAQAVPGVRQGPALPEQPWHGPAGRALDPLHSEAPAGAEC